MAAALSHWDQNAYKLLLFSHTFDSWSKFPLTKRSNKVKLSHSKVNFNVWAINKRHFVCSISKWISRTHIPGILCIMQTHVLRVQHVCASTFIPRWRGAKKRATFDVARIPPVFQTKPKIQRRRKGDRRNRQKRRRTGIQLEFHNPFRAKKYKREREKEYDTRLPTLSHSCRARLKLFCVAKCVWQ